LLCDVVEIKIIITHEGETAIGFFLDLLNDRGAGWEHEDMNADLKDDVGLWDVPKDGLSRTR
jgi:hypothetical protein